MKTVKVTMFIDTNDRDELARILDHHIDWLVDMDANRDVIEIIYGVTVEDVPSDKNPATVA